jgi:hypothetical protein
MEQSPLEADGHSASQKSFPFMEPEVLLQCSQEQVTEIYLESVESILHPHTVFI